MNRPIDIPENKRKHLVKLFKIPRWRILFDIYKGLNEQALLDRLEGR